MTTQDRVMADAQIRSFLTERTNALQAKDVEAVIAGYAPDVRWFDVVNPLRHDGTTAMSERLHAWLDAFTGPLSFELRDVRVVVDDEAAFSHFLTGVKGTTARGALEMWFRVTVCLRRIADRWLIVHEHSSVPFDPETGMASLALKP
jgi:uncharacterized protein (TIGR02246 family)